MEKNTVHTMTRLPINITISKEDLESDDEVLDDSISEKNNTHKKNSIRLASKIQTGMKNFDVYVDLYPNKEKSSLQSSLTDSDGLNKLDKTEIDQHKTEVDKHMEKSVLKPGFEKAEKAPTMLKSRRLLKKERKIEAEKTKGKQWYNLPATEMTEEKLRDLEVIQMRSILNPKQFYKKNDMKVVPKYFQVGTVVDSAADFYHDRIPKKQRKKTLVDELMADANFQRYNKQKYAEIIKTQPSNGPPPSKKSK